jgi:cysteine desulfurase
MAKRRIYLDHNATTPLHPEVKKTISEGMEIFGNPSKRIASSIGATASEIIFVGSGSEANNTVLSIFECPSARCTFHHTMRKDIITTRIEHPCVLETSKCLQDRGVRVKYLDVDNYGKVKLEQLKQLLDNNIGLVSAMMANNEIGTIQDIKTIAEITHDRGALFHTDAVQAIGKIPVNVQELGVDFLTISGHKIYGPKGVGALYIKKGIPFCPLIRGGHQERGRRAGTENTIGIIGLAKAVEMRLKEMGDEGKRLLNLKSELKRGIQEKIPDIQFNGHPTDCLANTLNVSFGGAEGEAILLYLDLEGIAVSTGSACASGSLDPSHVLLAAGFV